MADLPQSEDRLGWAEFSDAIRVQSRVIGALLMREVLTRYGRHNIGFLWLFAEPMIFTLGIVTLWTMTRSVHGSSLPIVAFAITGYSSVLMWRNMPGRLIQAILPNGGLLYHRNVKILDIYVSRLVLEWIGATTSFVVLVTVFHAIDWLQLPEDAMQVLMGWLMLTWFGSALAISVGALSEMFEATDKIWGPFSYLLFPFSGAAFIVDALPQAVQQYALYLPMLNAVEYLREGYFGTAFIAHYDIPYLIVFNLVLTYIGLSLTRHVAKVARPE